MTSVFSFSRKILLFCLVVAAPSGLLANAIDVHDFASQEEHDRYINLVKQIRCPKCQNQNILDSNSQISIDLRNQVARLVKEKKSDNDIKSYMVNRYSEFVLYDTPLTAGTLLLWYGPFVMLVIGVLVFMFSVWQRRKNALPESEGQANQAETGGAAE